MWPRGSMCPFVLLKHGHTPSAGFVGMLPKTRSGMRRVLKAVILDRDPGDITTIEDEGSVDETRQAWLHMKAEVEGVKSEPSEV